MKYKEINIQQIQELLIYSSSTGEFVWKAKAPKKVRGKAAGTVDCNGYLVITIKGKKYKAARLAWALHYGKDPNEKAVDHINRNPLDNRINNLRLATLAENSGNTCRKGISKDKNRWVARVHHQGETIYLGSFECPLLARIAYEDKYRELHGVFCPF